jgi:hypothetical protein
VSLKIRAPYDVLGVLYPLVSTSWNFANVNILVLISSTFSSATFELKPSVTSNCIFVICGGL